MENKTVFSPCRSYRYTLWREWIGGNGYVMFVGLNPSTADEQQDDPTIRRCIGFAKSWGFGALCMTNLFAYRATDPKIMMASNDPIGTDNNKWLLEIKNSASLVVAAWGVNGTHLDRDIEVQKLLGAMDCLDVTKYGCPKHPLYVRADVVRQPWSIEG